MGKKVLIIGAGGVSQVVEVLFRAVIPSRRKPVGEEFGGSAEFLNISGLWRSNLEDLMTFNVGDIFGNAGGDELCPYCSTVDTTTTSRFGSARISASSKRIGRSCSCEKSGSWSSKCGERGSLLCE